MRSRSKDKFRSRSQQCERLAALHRSRDTDLNVDPLPPSTAHTHTESARTRDTKAAGTRATLRFVWPRTYSSIRTPVHGVRRRCFGAWCRLCTSTVSPPRPHAGRHRFPVPACAGRWHARGPGVWEHCRPGGGFTSQVALRAPRGSVAIPAGLRGDGRGALWRCVVKPPVLSAFRHLPPSPPLPSPPLPSPPSLPPRRSTLPSCLGVDGLDGGGEVRIGAPRVLALFVHV